LILDTFHLIKKINIMKIKLYLALVTVSIFISSCLPTPYQRLKWDEGYTETQLDSNVYKVIFKSNRYTEIDMNSDFLLLRCAEVTLENGYNYFITPEENQYNELTSEDSISTKPRSSRIIVCYKNKPEKFAYNAKFVTKSLKKKYNISESYKKMHGIR